MGVVQPLVGVGVPATAAWKTSGRRSTAPAARNPPNDSHGSPPAPGPGRGSALPVGVRNYGSVPEQRFRYIPRCSSSCSSSSERWRACSPDVGPTVARRTSRSWCCATNSGCSSARRVGPDSKHQTGCSSRRRAAASRESDGRRRWLHRRPCCDGTANSCAGSGPTGTPSHQGVPQLPQRSGSWCSGSLARTPDGGCVRIQGELRKLGIHLGATTIPHAAQEAGPRSGSKAGRPELDRVSAGAGARRRRLRPLRRGDPVAQHEGGPRTALHADAR